MIKLFAIYPTDSTLSYAPTMVKINNTTSALVAFIDRTNAELFVKEKLNSPNFEVKELTLLDFGKARTEEKAYLGVDVVIKIFD